jgi:hypothetical protein
MSKLEFPNLECYSFFKVFTVTYCVIDMKSTHIPADGQVAPVVTYNFISTMMNIMYTEEYHLLGYDPM